MLVIRCCHCGSAHEDDLELFDAGEWHTMRCPDCGGNFQFFIHECPACGHESVHSRPDGGGAEGPPAIGKCEACGSEVRHFADVSGS